MVSVMATGSVPTTNATGMQTRSNRISTWRML